MKKMKYGLVVMKDKFLEGIDELWNTETERWEKVFIKECGTILLTKEFIVRRPLNLK